MVGAQVEYLGFVTKGRSREYTLRVRPSSGDLHEFTLSISTDAFLSHRVRYQDAPEICYLKLQRALAASIGALPPAHLSVSDADLEEYRVAHAPRPNGRRPKAPQAT